MKALVSECPGEARAWPTNLWPASILWALTALSTAPRGPGDPNPGGGEGRGKPLRLTGGKAQTTGTPLTRGKEGFPQEEAQDQWHTRASSRLPGGFAKPNRTRLCVHFLSRGKGPGGSGLGRQEGDH